MCRQNHIHKIIKRFLKLKKVSCVYVCVSLCIWPCEVVVELEVQAVVSCSLWVLGTVNSPRSPAGLEFAIFLPQLLSTLVLHLCVWSHNNTCECQDVCGGGSRTISRFSTSHHVCCRAPTQVTSLGDSTFAHGATLLALYLTFSSGLFKNLEITSRTYLSLPF